jgi:ELWxxDGT repeat protein
MATTHRPLAVFALIAAASAAATAPPAGAAEPYLVRDINPEAGPPLGSDPRLTLVGDEHLFFFARDEVHGEEPWTTDGTAAGTRLLRDVCPGECPSSSEWQWALGERLLFSARSGPADERRLWASNGTWAGTVPLDTGVIRGFPLVGGLEDRGLYFFAAHQGETEGLWVTDGTPAGTRRLGVASPNGWPLSPYGDSSRTEGTLLFGAYRTATGYEPWASNGTEAGTRLVADLFPGPGSSTPFAFRQLPAGTTFFAAADFCTLSLWVSDGTPARTRRLGDFSDAECRTPVMTTVLRAGGAVYFVPTQGTAPRQLWRSDGTPAGTRALTSFTDEAFDGRSSYPDRMEASDQGVLFAADDGVHGSEPWFADAGGARLVADLCPGPCSSSPEAPAWLAGHFYFSADDGGSGEELWRSDGTAAGTRLVHDACPGSCGSHPVPVGSAAGRVFFLALLNLQWVAAGRCGYRRR